MRRFLKLNGRGALLAAGIATLVFVSSGLGSASTAMASSTPKPNTVKPNLVHVVHIHSAALPNATNCHNPIYISGSTGNWFWNGSTVVALGTNETVLCEISVTFNGIGWTEYRFQGTSTCATQNSNTNVDGTACTNKASEDWTLDSNGFLFTAYSYFNESDDYVATGCTSVDCSTINFQRINNSAAQSWSSSPA